MPGRRVTAADVARAAGISRATVGYVLNNTPGQTISEDTRRRVLAESARLGYRPHRAAQDLRRGSSKVILFVLPEWPMETMMGQHLDQAALDLDEAGYSLVTWARQPGRRTRPLWELLVPDVVMGLAMFDDDELASMRASGITKIIPDPANPQPLRDWPAIATGAKLQVEHLWERGHRRLGCAVPTDPRLARMIDARVDVARLAAARLGVETLDVRAVDYLDGSATEVVDQWRRAGITGVAGFNDETAAAVVSAAVRAGVPVPEELAVIGHDDTPLATMFVPSISSIRLDVLGLGRRFAALALGTAEGRPVRADGWEGGITVIARESTRAR
ncbi:LacI family DNA-binding transcriptional regulator [Nocardia pseudovaccinii]|uniref:LacI family DNA-binding transcriptional regulator n=1 Tax=Nocardia pseudovaccinii TaxID=189540 RepID=UPI003D8FA30E